MTEILQIFEVCRPNSKRNRANSRTKGSLSFNQCIRGPHSKESDFRQGVKRFPNRLTGTVLSELSLHTKPGSNKFSEWMQLPSCPARNAQSKDHNNRIRIFAPVAGTITFLFFFLLILGPIYRRRKIKSDAPSDILARDGFNQKNLLGTASFGSVYKGIMGDNNGIFGKEFKIRMAINKANLRFAVLLVLIFGGAIPKVSGLGCSSEFPLCQGLGDCTRFPNVTACCELVGCSDYGYCAPTLNCPSFYKAGVPRMADTPEGG